MVVSNLGEAIRAKVAEALKEYRLPVEKGEPRTPQIFNCFLPPKRAGVQDDFPFVAVITRHGEVDYDQTIVTVPIVIGCYSKEYDGHEYCFNVLQRLISELCRMPGGCLADKYILQYPLKWDLLEEQAYPYWEVHLETKWMLQSPQPEMTEEM